MGMHTRHPNTYLADMKTRYNDLAIQKRAVTYDVLHKRNTAGFDWPGTVQLLAELNMEFERLTIRIFEAKLQAKVNKEEGGD